MYKKLICSLVNIQQKYPHIASSSLIVIIMQVILKQVSALENKAPDGGFGWIIVICTFFVLFTCSVMVTSFSILLVPFKEAFPNKETATISLLSSVRDLVMYAGSEYFPKWHILGTIGWVNSRPVFLFYLIDCFRILSPIY